MRFSFYFSRHYTNQILFDDKTTDSYIIRAPLLNEIFFVPQSDLRTLEGKILASMNRKTGSKTHELMRKITAGDFDSFQFDAQSSRDGSDSLAYLQRKVDEEFENFKNAHKVDTSRVSIPNNIRKSSIIEEKLQVPSFTMDTKEE